jgi:hypothetical protein
MGISLRAGFWQQTDKARRISGLAGEDLMKARGVIPVSEARDANANPLPSWERVPASAGG